MACGHRKARESVDAFERNGGNGNTEPSGGARHTLGKLSLVAGLCSARIEQVLQSWPGAGARAGAGAGERLRAVARPSLENPTLCRDGSELIFRILTLGPMQVRHTQTLPRLRRLTAIEQLDPIDARGKRH